MIPLPEPLYGPGFEVTVARDCYTADQMREYAAAAVAAERERCAKACEAVRGFTKAQCEHFAAAIREVKE